MLHSSADLRPEECATDDVVRLVILSSARLTRESLSELLPRNPRLQIAGAFEQLSRAAPELRGLKTDLALVDAASSSARAGVAEMRARAPDLAIVVFSISETLEEIVSWAQAGACAYVPKMSSLTEMAEILINSHNQQRSRSLFPSVQSDLTSLAASGRATGAGGNSQAPLTGRETEVMRLVSRGMSNKEIARVLDVSVATIKTHVHHILGKMNVRRRSQAAHGLNQDGRAAIDWPGAETLLRA